MKSSSGAHYVALDHARALAAFMVFAWHFTHGDVGASETHAGAPVLLEGAPLLFPLALLDEGHTGVALFMTLSGFLFAKILDGRRIDYWAFLRNRALRLLPLLIVVVLIVSALRLLAGQSLIDCIRPVLWGLVKPTLPNGGWSITIEFHFYLLLPALLLLVRRNVYWALVVLAAAAFMRTMFLYETGETQSVAYWYIFGRIDQFMLGILAARFQPAMVGRHRLMLALFAAFALFYWAFDASGGFFPVSGFPSGSPIWIVMPLIEGAFYAAALAWYDGSFLFSNRGVSGFVARMGAYSYSIYLLHTFFVFDAAAFIDSRIMSLENFYVATAWSIPVFLLMIVPGFLSYRYIESPFLRLRSSYILPEATAAKKPASKLFAPAG